MKRIYTLLVTLVLSFAVAVPVFAAGDIIVTFQNTPLFSGAAIFPGSVTARAVAVQNTGGGAQTLYTEVASTTNDGLAEVMVLTIVEGDATLYSGTFADFFALNPGVSLGSIAAGQTREFTYTATFPESAGNTAQGKTLGFNLVIGFEGGTTVTDGGGTTTTGSGGGTSGGSAGTSGQGGSFDNNNLATTFFAPVTDVINSAINTATGRVLGERVDASTDEAGRVLSEEDAKVQEVVVETEDNPATAACFFCAQNCIFSWVIIVSGIVLAWLALAYTVFKKSQDDTLLLARDLYGIVISLIGIALATYSNFACPLWPLLILLALAILSRLRIIMEQT